MKNILLITLLAVLVSTFANAQIPNAGFENWSIDPNSGILMPDGWTSDQVFVDSPAVVQAPGHTGNYSVKFISYDAGGSQFYAGNLYVVDFPIHAVPISISGYWQLNCLATSNDEIWMASQVTDAAYHQLIIHVRQLPFL